MKTNYIYYYLHTNNTLIYKPAIVVNMDDNYFDSPMVKKYWKVILNDVNSINSFLSDAKKLGASDKTINDAKSEIEQLKKQLNLFESKKYNKSEKQILKEGFLKNFLGGVLAYGFLKGSEEKKQKHELVRKFGDEKEETAKQVKKDAELKKLLEKFSSTSSDLYQYVKRNRKKGDAYERIYQKLAEFY